MRAGILSRFTRQGPQVGLELLADGAVALSAQERNGVQTADHLELFSGRALDLTHWSRANQLKGAGCRAVLGFEQYQLLLVEPPDVPAAEMKNALRWRLKDLLNMPLDEAVIDIFELPDDGTRSNKKMLYVAAAEKSRILELADSLRRADLRLLSVDINELALRNLAHKILCDNESERGLALVRLRQGGGSVCLYKGGNLYFARNIALDYGAGLFDDLPEDTLALELQRSMDYYERQMGQASPAVVYICGDNVLEDKLSPGLRANVAAQVQYLDPAAVAVMPDTVTSELRQSALAALGAVLRRTGSVH